MWYPIIIQDNIPASVLLHLLVFVFGYLVLREHQHHKTHEDLKKVNRDLVRIVRSLVHERSVSRAMPPEELSSNLVILDDHRRKSRRHQH